MYDESKLRNTIYFIIRLKVFMLSSLNVMKHESYLKINQKNKNLISLKTLILKKIQNIIDGPPIL